MVEFDGPFVFKWSMYDTLEPWGPLSGSVSISVGSFTEYNCMGTDVIKSPKRHPDALRGSGIKAPAERKARTTKASSDNRRTKQASQNSRTAPLAGGSGSESTSTSDERDGSRPSGRPQAQYYSDSQSGGEGPAAAYSPLAADRSNSQSMRGGFVDSDYLLEPVGRVGEKLLNAVAAEQGERRRGEGQAAPA